MDNYKPRSKLRKDVIKVIVRSLRKGATPHGAAGDACIDHHTLSAWEEEIAEKEIEPLDKSVKEADVPERDTSPESREFLLAFYVREKVKAYNSFRNKHLKNIEKAGSKQWQASAWLLERVFPSDYGRPERVLSVEGGDDELGKYIQSNLEAAARRMNGKDSD